MLYLKAFARKGILAEIIFVAKVAGLHQFRNRHKVFLIDFVLNQVEMN